MDLQNAAKPAPAETEHGLHETFRLATERLDNAGLGFAIYPDGRIAEIYLSANRIGSPIEAIAPDAAVTVSIALQFGADLERFAPR